MNFLKALGIFVVAIIIMLFTYYTTKESKIIYYDLFYSDMVKQSIKDNVKRSCLK